MPQTPFKNAQSDRNSRFFGLRIESRLLQVAIATPTDSGRYRLEIDDVRCPSQSGWLTVTGAPMLEEALANLVEKHDIRRQRVAVSLDGDFCVTRVAMGTTEKVDQELAALADRAPRYLQLGPGEKVTGSSRHRIDPTVDYAVTGVVNRNLIQLIYNALRTVDIQIPWVEPSLVSVARLVGEAKIGNDRPVMIADGTGQQWDVGITCAGRLLLDYRPAAATSEKAFREALHGHISRLRRFCHRRRGIASGELNQLLLCGNGEKLERAVKEFGKSTGIEPTILHVPRLEELYEIDPSDREARCVPAVATVLPLLTGVAEEDVPDLLTEVRRAPDLPWHIRWLRSGWPAAAATIVLLASFFLVSGQRRQSAEFSDQRESMKQAFDATQARFAELSAQRELANYLRLIEEKTRQEDWDRLLGQVTKCLPDAGKLNEFRVESGGVIRLDGTMFDEVAVYDLVENLRQLPRITQVALKGTNPDGETGGTRFVIRLTTNAPILAERGARYE